MLNPIQTKITSSVRLILGMGLVNIISLWPAAARADGPLIAECEIPVAVGMPALDGELGDAAWRQAAEIRGFRRLGGNDVMTEQRAMLMADNTWLFVGFEIVHPKPSEIITRVLDRSLDVIRDDSVEVFVDPGAEGQVYYQFGLNAAGYGGARRNIAAGSDITSKIQRPIPWRYAAKLTDKGWNAEIAIPLALLSSSGDLKQARINLCINRMIPISTVEDVSMGHEREHASWAPLVRSYHEPEHFIPMQGLGDIPVNAPFFPILGNITVSDYDIMRKECTVQLELANAFDTPGTSEVAICEIPDAAAPHEWRTALSFQGGEKRLEPLRVPVKHPGASRLRVTVRDALSGALLQSAELAPDRMAGMDLLKAYAGRSFYTDEKAAEIICLTTVKNPLNKNLRLKARDSSGGVMASAAVSGNATVLEIPLAGLVAGRHAVKVELCLPDDALVARQKVFLDKKASRPGLEWKIDHVNRVLMKNGRPHFPFGICALINLDDAAEWRELGQVFNCIVHWNRGSGDYRDVQSFAEMAARHNLDFIPYARQFFGPAKESAQAVNARLKKAGHARATQMVLDDIMVSQAPLIVKGVESVCDLPNIMGYFAWDEPRYTVYDVSVAGRAVYEIIRQADGYRPAFVNYSSFIPAGDKYTDWFDVLMTDPYWTPGRPTHIGSPNWVSRRTHEINLLAAPARFRQPIMIVPQAERTSGTYKRALLPREQRVQTYLALIHGAKGIVYWYYPVGHQATFDILAELGAEMRVLGPMIVAPAPSCAIAYAPGQLDPSNNIFPEVQAALFANPAGGYTLLAANSMPYPVDAAFELAGVQDGATLAGLFDDKSYTVKNGALQDSLAGYATCAYTYDGSAPPEIMVRSDGHPEQFAPEPPGFTTRGRPDRKNILPNSSFEECSLPGWPDYVWVINRKHKFSPKNRLGGPAPFFTAVNDNPFHGNLCLRVISEDDIPGIGNRDALSITVSPQVSQPEPYVFSAYMRANRPGVKARINSASWKGETFELTTEWRRYYVADIIPPGLYHRNMFYIWIIGNPGDNMWVDAVQMERGMTPTEYEP